MEGIVSHETQLKALSIVDDVKAELDRIEEENTPAESVMDRALFNAQAEILNEGTNDE